MVVVDRGQSGLLIVALNWELVMDNGRYDMKNGRALLSVQCLEGLLLWLNRTAGRSGGESHTLEPPGATSDATKL